ncbi:hypothetical protein [Microbacterium arborescens]|nr:hypothetical protein [Microbacterium arborescens]
MKKTNAALLLTATLLLSGCASAKPDAGATEATPTPMIATQSTKPSPTPLADRDGDGVPDARDDFPDDPARSEQLRYPSGDPVLDGYPLIVDTEQLDYRLASWIKTPQSVALAPGVYAGYNPAVTDLSVYLDGPADGDCAVRDLYAFGGGACWNGVLASPAEPAQ